MKAGLILTTEFNSPKDGEYKEFIEYMDREDAKEKEDEKNRYENFIEYMDTSHKKDNENRKENNIKLFTNDKENLTIEDKKRLKNLYKEAQEKKSVLWKGVFSFDNEYIDELGLINSNGKLNEGKIIQAARKGINELIEKEKLKNPIWTGEIHYNTKHYHVHFSIVEMIPTREVKKSELSKNKKVDFKNIIEDDSKGKAKFKVSSFRKAKSKMIESLKDRTEEFEKINELIREKIVNKQKSIDTFRDKEMKKRFLNIIKDLPENKTYWQYGYNKINYIKPKLNELSKFYIDNYCKEDFKELNKLLDESNDYYKRVYGKKKESKFTNKESKDYKEKKLDDLYKRMGNSFLREMRDYVKNEEKRLRLKKDKEYKERLEKSKSENKINVRVTKSTINKVKKALKNDIQHMKNQEQYIKLQREIENDNTINNQINNKIEKSNELEI